MKFVDTAIARFDAFQRRHPFVGFPYAVIKKYGDDEASYQAALLAYYGFLSLFPLLLVLTTSLAVLLRGHQQLQDKVLAGATQYFPVIGPDLQQHIHGSGKTGIALVIGTLLTLYGARGVADVLRHAVNHVWQVPYIRRPGFPKGIIKSLSIIVVGGIGLLSAPLLSGYALNYNQSVIMKLLALVLTAAILFSVFVFLGHVALAVRRPVKDLWVGAAFATVGLLLLQSLGAYLLKHELKNLTNLYSTFAVVLGLLYWLFLQAQVIMYALEIDSVRVLGLAPRSINQKSLTDQDRKAFRLYAHRNRFHDEEEIDVYTKKDRT